MSVTAEPSDDGFEVSFYPVLVDFGVAAFPAAVVAGMLATWLIDAWKKSGSPSDTAVGVEMDNREPLTITLSDGDVDRVAKRVLTLLEDQAVSGDAKDQS